MKRRRGTRTVVRVLLLALATGTVVLALSEQRADAHTPSTTATLLEVHAHRAGLLPGDGTAAAHEDDR